MGGVQEVIRQIATRLVAAGDDVTVATGAWPGRPRDCMMDGVRVVSFDISGNAVTGMTGVIAEYQAFILNGRFDAILIKAAQQWSFDASLPVLGRVSSRKVFIPCGFSGLNDARYQEYYSNLPNYLRLFDTLIFYSAICEDYKYAVRHGFQNIKILTNGTDEREFNDLDTGDIRSRIGVSNGDVLILSVGSLIPGKGHWELLAAFRSAELPGPATLVINANSPGGGLVTRALQCVSRISKGYPPLPIATMCASRQGQRVVLTDLARPDLVSLFKAADLLVLASRVEYSPLVLFEAAAAGTPFLSTDVGNSREIAQLTGAGRILRARMSGTSRRERTAFASELSSELVSALSDDDALAQMAASGRATFLAGAFQWRSIVPMYRAILVGADPHSFGS